MVHQGDGHQASYLSGKLALRPADCRAGGNGHRARSLLDGRSRRWSRAPATGIELLGPEVWLLVHRELADLARVRVVLDVLAQCARADVGRFAGRTKQVAGN